MKKCNPKKVQFCDAIKEVATKGLRIMETKNRVTGEKSKKLVLQTGSDAPNDYVFLNFCPACGVPQVS